MRDLIRDPKYKAANAIPFAFREGDQVVKKSGDYVFSGTVLSAFRKRSGSPRYAVENEDGLIHIFNHEQLCRANCVTLPVIRVEGLRVEPESTS